MQTLQGGVSRLYTSVILKNWLSTSPEDGGLNHNICGATTKNGGTCMNFKKTGQGRCMFHLDQD
jgi:hypothetical protein